MPIAFQAKQTQPRGENIPGIKAIATDMFQWLALWCNGNNTPQAEQTKDWSEREWNIARAVIIIHGMGPLWGYLLSQYQGEHNLPATFVDFLKQQFTENSKRLALMAKEKNRVLAALSEQGIQVLPFKGIELAGRLYPHQGARPMADIDLYICHEQRSRVCRLLERLEYKIHAQNPYGMTCYPGHWTSSASDSPLPVNWHGDHINTASKALLLLGESSKLPFSLDIHFSMNQGARETRFNLDPVFRNACLHSLPLSREHELVYQLLHATKHLRSHSGRWIHLYDICQMLNQSGIDWQQVSTLTIKENLVPQILLPLKLTRQTFNTATTELEGMLTQELPRHFGYIFEQLDLTELSYCNPYIMNFWHSLLWIHNLDHLKQWLFFSLTADKTSSMLVDGQVQPLASFSSRMRQAFNKLVTKATRPQWQIFALQGLNPGKDWR